MTFFNIEDTTAPSVSITQPKENIYINPSEITIAWSGSDTGSGIDHYEVKIDDNTWEPVNGTSYEFAKLGEGSHVVEVKAVDTSEKTNTASIAFTVNTIPIGGPGMMEEFAIISAVVVVILAAVALYFFKLKKV